MQLLSFQELKKRETQKENQQNKGEKWWILQFWLIISAKNKIKNGIFTKTPEKKKLEMRFFDKKKTQKVNQPKKKKREKNSEIYWFECLVEKWKKPLL